MKDMFIVAKFTMKEMIKRKSFIISTIIIMALIVIGFNVPNIIKVIKGNDDDVSKEKILLVDRDNLFEGNLSAETLNNSDLGYEFVVTQEDDDSVKSEIKEGTYKFAFIFKKADELNYKVDYVVDSFNETMDYYPEDLINTFNDFYHNIQITKLGLTEAQLSKINAKFTPEVVTVGENAEGNVFTCLMVSIVLFYAVYFCAYQVSTAITVEKTSKIVETLATSTSTTNIIVGKTVGIGLVGFVQVLAFVIVAVITAMFCVDKAILDSIFDMKNITLWLGVASMAYFLIGYFFYSFMYALTGSTVAKPEDVNSANTPVTIITMVGFYFAYMTMISPTSSLNGIASFLPISSPFCMPCRIMMGLATTQDVIISLGILLVSTILVALIAVKVYSSAILNTGTKMSIKQALALAKNKKN